MRIASSFLAAALAAGVLVAPTGVEADPVRAQRTRQSDEVTRDRQELEAFEEIVGVAHRTAAKRNKKEYMKLTLNLHSAMVREVEQAEEKAIRARRDGDGESGAREEKRNLWTAEGRYDTMSDLVRESEDLIPMLQKWDRKAVARNRDILDQFLEIMIADLRASGGTWRTEQI
jgi:hypothetical protein